MAKFKRHAQAIKPTDTAQATIHPTFPPQASPQPVYLGSQSQSPGEIGLSGPQNPSAPYAQPEGF